MGNYNKYENDKFSIWRFISEHTFIIRHVLITVLAFVIVAFFAWITILAKPLDPISNAVKEFSFTDIYYGVLSSTGDPDTNRVVTIVDLTEIVNRGDIAKVLEDIESCHPKVVGCDCVFEIENLQSPEANDSITFVADKYKNIVWATMLLDYSTKSDSIGYTRMRSSFFKQYTDISEGCVNMPRGSLHDSMKRQVPMFTLYNGKKIPSFCAQVADKYSGKKLSAGYAELIKINYSPTVFRKIQPSEVLKNKDLIEGQIVLFGTLNDNNDMHWTPIGRIPGVEVLAYGIQTVIEDKAVRNANTFELCLISFFIVLIVQLLQTKYLELTGSSKNLFIRFVIGSTYVMGILTFLFTSIFILFGFLAFELFNVSYSLGWALSVVAFLGTSRNMYTALKDYFTHAIDKKKEG